MFENITLEMSLKPFKQTDENYIRNVCSGIFDQWRALLKGRKTISIMLWVGDGSEILDYAGNLQDAFEWCRFFGNANLPHLEKDAPLETSLYVRKQDYIDNAPVMTYDILKSIIRCLKEEGKKSFPSAVIRVGETFDIGSEFAISDFKYHRHTEICYKLSHSENIFVDSTASLNADHRAYAAYPMGIPDDISFSKFFAMQSECFLKDMGFDFLWLSNGFGFSVNPWDVTGKIFDGEKFYPEKLEETKQNVLNFWKQFRENCTFPIETRGTNNSVGIDYSTDGVPLYDIYNSNLNIVPPPNSPWAALNDDFGLEIMGHMTRICELPGNVIPFRYYLHDPWWLNSPWYDRYDGAPSDIYLPMAISRITSDGRVETANSLNILSIDNARGNMPDSCVNESLPHILKAEKDAPDKPSPIVWIYPMREFTTSNDESLLLEMYLGDNFIRNAINNGLPLSCVTSTDSFMAHNFDVYKNSCIIVPAIEDKAIWDKLYSLGENGVGILMYGTPEKLKIIKEFNNLIKIDVNNDPLELRKAWERFGYSIKFIKKIDAVKPPTLSIVPCNSGFFFSAYNVNTTTKALFKFPNGAPILNGCETELVDGYSSYSFSRGEHRECRVFIEQNDGVISCRESPPENVRYRRSIKISGLQDATVRLFAETDCECAVSLRPCVTFQLDSRFVLVNDEINGPYLKGEHINGTIYFVIGHKETAK